MTTGALEQFSTREMDPAGKLDLLNEMLDATFPGLVLNPRSQSFDAQIARWQLADLMMIWPDCPGSVVARNRSASRISSQRLVLHLLHSGRCRLSQRGRTIEMEPGDIVVCAGEEDYKFDIADRHQMLVVDMDRSALSGKVGNLDDCIARRIPGSLAGSRMLRNFLISLWQEGAGRLSAAQQRDYSRIVTNLIATPFNGPLEEQLDPGEAFARMAACVEARLSDPGLTPASLAREMCVSLRLLQMIAAGAGTTPGRYITGRRMERAAAKLSTDAHKRITDIAFECGFTDGAYFARRFAERFGLSPSEYRKSH